MSRTSEHWVNMYTRIDAHLEHCKAAGYSTETTIPDRREILCRVIHDLGADLRTVTPARITRWLAHDGWSPKTRATYYEHLNGYYRWELANGGVNANPMSLVPRPRVPARQPRGVPDWVVGVVLGQAVEPWLTAATLARYAGLRCFEIARVQLADITQPPQGYIHVQGKGGRVDQIPTSPVIWSHIRGRRPGHLVRPTVGLAYRPKTLSTAFAHYCRTQLGVEVALHDLRRHFGNSLRRAGIDLEVVRQLMRHESLETTQKYLNVRDDERRAGIQALAVPTGSQLKAA